MSAMKLRDVYLVMGKRSPQAKAGTDLKNVGVPYLASYLVRHLMDSFNIPSDVIDEVVMGNVGAPAKYPNIGRVVALEAGLDKKTSAYTVHRNCASGMEAMSQAFVKIACGRADLMIAGGLESMSQMPLIYNKEMTDLFIHLMKAKSLPEKLKALSVFRPPFLSPIVAIEQGLTDPFCNLNMGQTAEILAREMNITREEQDNFANQSHLKAIRAQSEGKMKEEIVPIAVGSKLDKLLEIDTGPRANSTVEGLGKMKPYFERVTGTVTVGNSCPITDGASAFLMASEDAVKKYNLKPMAKMTDFHFAGLEPERMGMGPLLAIDGVLRRAGKELRDMDVVEINEAFAAQVLGVLRGLKDKEVAKRFGLDKAWGEIPEGNLNPNGGGIALGHPVGSSGSRIVVTLAHELKRRKARFGLATLCIGGGQGGAVVIENIQ